MRKEPIIIGNWKMHKTPAEAVAFIEALNCKAHLAVPFPALQAASEAARGKDIEIGAQDLCEHSAGAFTGEVSGEMIRACGASFVLVGHSERRHIYGESDELINAKLKQAIKAGLMPVLCIGETLSERELNKTEEVLERQLTLGLEGVDAPFIIAYEPVWAIGTGKSASAQMAEQAHVAIRRFLKNIKVPILYGGSVNPSNAKELLRQDNIDGALVGGASLDVKTFTSIIRG
ncbi:MAG: triose-phosphate isomerase [Chlamydiales bacterium]|nr:triose-phosphate isomerase [Chlamydiales bacterium]